MDRSFTLLFRVRSVVSPQARFLNQIPGLWFAACPVLIMQACSRVVHPLPRGPSSQPSLPDGGRLPLGGVRLTRQEALAVTVSHDGRTGKQRRREEGQKEEVRRRGKKFLFMLGAQKSILNTKVYQSKWSLAFAASLIFPSETFPPLPHPASPTFPPVNALKWNRALDSQRVQKHRHIMKN